MKTLISTIALVALSSSFATAGEYFKETWTNHKGESITRSFDENGVKTRVNNTTGTVTVSQSSAAKTAKIAATHAMTNANAAAQATVVSNYNAGLAANEASDAAAIDALRAKFGS